MILCAEERNKVKRRCEVQVGGCKYLGLLGRQGRQGRQVRPLSRIQQARIEPDRATSRLHVEAFSHQFASTGNLLTCGKCFGASFLGNDTGSRHWKEDELRIKGPNGVVTVRDLVFGATWPIPSQVRWGIVFFFFGSSQGQGWDPMGSHRYAAQVRRYSAYIPWIWDDKYLPPTYI